VKRYSLRDAFIGEPNPHMEGMAAVGTGQDAMEFTVRGGTLTIIVPHDMPDDEVFLSDLRVDHAPWELELELESGMRLTLWLPEGPTCADLRWKRK
jgi:hypothetical protein